MRDPRSRSDVAPEATDEGRALAERARAREPQAWTEIFESHYRAIFRFVRFRLSDPEQAEDLASQTFEVAFRSVDRFDYRGVPIEAWLIGIARNLVRDQIKKLSRREPTAELEEADVPVPPDEVEAVALRQDLAGAFVHLTDDQQTVLALRFLEDRSVLETAGLMRRSEDAVKNLQRRALAALRRVLAGTDYAKERER
ncbi:MAG: RNA polymerase sigma factor [Dehalococcoidia bacterium]